MHLGHGSLLVLDSASALEATSYCHRIGLALACSVGGQILSGDGIRGFLCRLDLRYEVLDRDDMGKQLASLVGILSDAAVHFTPEVLLQLDFQERELGTKVFSEYLEADDTEIARHLTMLAAVEGVPSLVEGWSAAVAPVTNYPVSVATVART
jgi:hypothetical protein